MELSARERVPELTGLLSLVSLTLVFAAVRGLVPDGLLPRIEPFIEVIPHLNALLSVCAIVTILLGVRAIRRGNVARHRMAMLTSTVLFATFLVCYLYRVSLEGPTTFSGPAAVKQFVYLPVLGIHILLAIICIPLVYYALLLAGTRSVSEIAETSHSKVGLVAARLWLVSFSLGLVVYLMLHVVF
jgi:putative membrane protein